MAIGLIIVLLMEKRSIENGKIDLEDIQSWSKKIIDFISLTDSPSFKQFIIIINLRSLYRILLI
jgi:hypothetical protein